MKSTSIRSPIKWVGGKSKIRMQIIEMLPPAGMYTCYVEVFGGAGWVLFGKQPSSVEILNDIDGELVNFYGVLKNNIHQLIQKLFNYPLVSRKDFTKLVATDPIRLNQIERAYRFFYILMASWGGEFDKPRFQTSIIDRGKGNRLFGALKTLRQRLYPVHERLSEVIIENLDWRKCIDRYDDPRTVMYLDPPYPQNNCNYSFNMTSFAEHEELVDRLSRMNSKWILTSYDKIEIRKLFSQFHIFPIKFSSGMDGKNGRRNQEIIVTNYDPKQLSKAYKRISSSSGIHDLAWGDQVIIRNGQNKNVIGIIDGFQNDKIVIKFNKDKKVIINATNIESRRKKYVYHTKQNDLSNLKREISTSLDSEILKKLDELKRDGYILDPAAKVNEILKKSLCLNGFAKRGNSL
jgi:DNA adenine methylase